MRVRGFLLVLVVGGCASSRDPMGMVIDGAVPDAAAPDAAAPDAAAPDARVIDAALPDAAIPDAAVPDAAVPDAEMPDAAIPDATADAAPDLTPPAAVTDLAATATGFDTIRLTWTAPGDDGATGTAAMYDVRYSLAPITTDPQFAAAASAGVAPAPVAAGGTQTMNVAGLGPGTTYHFALRARDEVPSSGGLSNPANATTFARAVLLISEVAPSNGAADNHDFVELVATAGGRTDGLSVTDAAGTLHSFSPFTVVAGDRIVIHLTGMPCPAGCAQEDASGLITASTAPGASAAAYDVYSSSSGLVATDSAIALRDGGAIVDAVPYSNRDGDASAAAMTAFGELRTASAWSFSATPIDGTTDCATQREAVNWATTDTTCGGFAVAAAARSLQRAGTSDSNSKADFFLAPHTPGAANVGNAAPTVVSASARSATEIRVRFDDEMAPATVLPARFDIPGLTVSAASLSDVHEVMLTTSAQAPGAPYVVTAMMLSDLQGTALGTPASARLCGFSATPPALLVNELSPAQPGGSDLVELRVTAGGGLAGITLRMNPDAAGAGSTLLATMPAICAQAGDLVVVHIIPPAGSAPASETISITEYAAPTYALNYNGAYDVLGSPSSGISATETVLILRDAGGNLLDAAAFSNQSAGASPMVFLNALAYIQGAGQWLPINCGGFMCTDSTTPTAKGVAASYMGVGSSPTGDSVRRSADTNQRTDWSVGAQSLGM